MPATTKGLAVRRVAAINKITPTYCPLASVEIEPSETDTNCPAVNKPNMTLRTNPDS
jgi:hypothetical protein